MVQNIGHWSSNVTNCITEIPNNIKLELNDGVLTLKAGSKLYFPNGAGVFDELVINSDKTVSISSFSGFVFYRSDNNIMHLEALQAISGTTPPSGDGTWYDIDANKIKRYENSSFVYDGISFPLCKCSSGSIDQVFNGFGYIGSTVFALPGVKWLGTNGRNADDTLKSIMCSNSNVMLHTFGSGAYTNLAILFLQDNIKISDAGSIIDWKYYEKENYWSENNLTSKYKWCALGYISISGGKILSFNPRGVFHAVDYNEFNEHRLIRRQYPNASNNYTFYMDYSDGYVEEGIHSDTYNAFTSEVTLQPHEGINMTNKWTLPIPLSCIIHANAEINGDSGIVAGDVLLEDDGTKLSCYIHNTYDVAKTIKTSGLIGTLLHSKFFVAGMKK